MKTIKKIIGVMVITATSLVPISTANAHFEPSPQEGGKKNEFYMMDNYFGHMFTGCHGRNYSMWQ
jgi:hypothetical protein